MADNIITGRAKKHDGTAIDYVSIFNWSDGKCIAQVTPDASGVWEFEYFNNINVGLTYVADGCEPITHGAYSFTAVWTPLTLEPKIYLEKRKAKWLGSVLQAWNGLGRNPLNMTAVGTVTKDNDGSLKWQSGNNYLTNESVEANTILSNVGKVWVFFVAKLPVDSATIVMFSGLNGDNFAARLVIFTEGGKLTVASTRYAGLVRRRFNTTKNVLSSDYNMYLLEHEWDTGRARWHINGVIDNSNDNFFDNKGRTHPSPAFKPISIGKYETSGTSNNHNQKQLIVKTDDRLTQDSIDKLFGYAAHEHGLVGKLPANHPYKVNKPV